MFKKKLFTLFFQNMNIYYDIFVDHFKKKYLHHQWEPNVLRNKVFDGLTHSWFHSFHGIC